MFVFVQLLLLHTSHILIMA